MHGFSYDDVHDEIVVNSPLAQAILTFRGGAKGEEAPIRVIQGPRTRILGDAYSALDKVSVDGVNNEIYLPMGRGGARGGPTDLPLPGLLVFDRNANGDVAPIRAIRGPDTMLEGGGGPPAIAVDPVTRTLIVATRGLLIFDSTANGNVKPLRVITGDGAGAGRLAAAHNGLIFAGSRGNSVGVWSVNDSGNAPARFKIGQGVLKEMRGLAVDAKNKSVIITDKELNAVMTWSVPEVFAQATGARTN